MSCTETIMIFPTAHKGRYVRNSNSSTSESNHRRGNNHSNVKCRQRLINATKLSNSIAKNKSTQSIGDDHSTDRCTSADCSIQYRINGYKCVPIINRIFLIVTIIIFASLSDSLIRRADGSDVTGVIQVSDNDKVHSKADGSTDSYEGIGITPSPGRSGANAGFYHEKIGNLEKIDTLEMSLAAVFNKVAYGTTTKRSIADTGFVPSLTTVPTPQLTTYR